MPWEKHPKQNKTIKPLRYFLLPQKWEAAKLTQGAQPGALWQSRKVGQGGVREVQGGGNISILMVDSCCCTLETNTL